MTVHFKNPLSTFIHVPKTGGTSFKDWTCSRLDAQRAGQHDTLRAAQVRWGDLGTTITIVRNPYDRLVSIYSSIQERYEQADWFLANSIGASDPEEIKNREYRIRMIQENFERGFEWWLESLCYRWDEMYLNESFPFLTATRPQVKWFSNQEIDIVIRLENLQRDLPKLQRLLGIDARIEKMNFSTHNDYKSYYTSSSKKIVEMMYKDDLEKFNYVF
jgi:hypothetical protein